MMFTGAALFRFFFPNRTAVKIADVLKVFYFRLYACRIRAYKFGSFLHGMGISPKSTYPNASVGAPCSTLRTVCSIRGRAVGFNTLRYDASVGVLNPLHESIHSKEGASRSVPVFGLNRLNFGILRAGKDRQTLPVLEKGRVSRLYG